MEKADIFRTLMEYDQALTQRVWESIQHLTEEQFIQDNTYSRGSIRDQMVHIAAAQKRWLLGLRSDREVRQNRIEPGDYPTVESAKTLWKSVSGELVQYVSALDDKSLESTPPGMRGPVWQVLAHLVNHSTDHRAQILQALHELGAPTFDQDLIYYLWRR